MRDAAEVRKEVDAVRAEHKMPLSLSDLGNERDSIYEQFDNLTDAPPEKESKEPEPEKVAAEPEKEKEPEKAEFVKEDKPTDEEKKVPLGALHEEREKRKALAKEVADLKESFRQAVEDNKKLMDLMSDKSDEPITDYEKEMLSLRKQLKVALTEIDSIKRGGEKERQASAEQRLDSLAKQTDTELEKAGFEGFYDFIPQVIKAMNDEEIPMEDRSPETWKRVYREVVYPKYIGKHKVVKKEDKKAEKEELKKEASLIKTPGKPEEKKKEEEDTPESYAKWRQKQSFFHNPI